MATIDQPAAVPRRFSARAITTSIAAISVAAIVGFLAVTVVASFVGDDKYVQPDSLQLVEGGIPTELPSAVPIRGSVSATFELVQTGDRFERSLDVYLANSQTETVADGEFTIHATVSMRFMDHDYFSADAVSSGNGHYLIPLVFSMPGEWQIDLDVTTPVGPASLALFVEVWS